MLTKNLNADTLIFKKYCYPSNKDSIYCNPVSRAEIVYAVSGFKSDKSPGP